MELRPVGWLGGRRESWRTADIGGRVPPLARLAWQSQRRVWRPAHVRLGQTLAGVRASEESARPVVVRLDLVARLDRAPEAARTRAAVARSTGSTQAAELARPSSRWSAEARWTPDRSTTCIRVAAAAPDRLLAAVAFLRAAGRAPR
jgi:hypothetical protein